MVRFWLSIFWRASWSIFASLVEQVFQNLAHFQADGVAVFEKLHFAGLGQRVGHDVRNFVDFVAADSHSTALYLRTSSLFTLRNISW